MERITISNDEHNISIWPDEISNYVKMQSESIDTSKWYNAGWIIEDEDNQWPVEAVNKTEESVASILYYLEEGIIAGDVIWVSQKARAWNEKAIILVSKVVQQVDDLLIAESVSQWIVAEL